MRSVLTTLGIVIGIVSVTLMATAIEGVNRAFDKSASAFGTDVLYIQRFPWISNEDWSTLPEPQAAGDAVCSQDRAAVACMRRPWRRSSPPAAA